jgi:plastocyanin
MTAGEEPRAGGEAMRTFTIGTRRAALVAGSLVTTALLGAAGFGWSHAAAPAHAADKPQVTVNIANFMYDPDPLQIAAGTVVTWVQNDSSRHSATDDNGAFDTGLMPQGGSGSVEFDFAGAYTYTCSIHPFMHGEIDVAGGGAQTSQQKPR